ncbi:MAG: molybdopterin molybdotransferase MoeA [Balneolaceae bacterium]|nr:molybdopterin molybdotransferase MoeA [Balneolaceae bacterium]
MMISIEQALSIVNKQKTEHTTTRVPLEESYGFWLAGEITAPFDLPSFDNSAMDGYAVSGIRESYQIVGELPAGNTSDYTLEPGEAMRIFTGAKVPANTSAVVMQEKTSVSGARLHVDAAVTERQHIRRKGNELEQGETVFARGHHITPATVGLIGSLGISHVTVFEKPAVRIISTGDELVPPGRSKSEGEIYESNSYALNAALQRFGFTCRERNQISDDFSAITSGISDFLDRSDLLLLSGGISVGEYDYVKKALEENGVTELFYKVFQKPGKPLFFGRRQQTFVFALPGNPASSLTCFYIYVLPLLQKLSGALQTGLQRVSVPIDHAYEYRSDRPVFLKANIRDQRVTILDRQCSSMIHSMAMGNAFVFLDGPQTVQKGDMVESILI